MPIELSTAIIAAVSVLAGSLVTAVVAARTTKAAERRADARELARAESAERERQRRLADDVANSLRDQLDLVRRAIQRDENGGMPFSEGYPEAWHSGIEMDLRQRVDRLSNDVLRRRLLLILECVDDEEVRRFTGLSWERHVYTLIDLGRDFAMVEVRGQQPEPDVVRRFDEYAEHHRLAWEQRDAASEADLEARQRNTHQRTGQ